MSERSSSDAVFKFPSTEELWLRGCDLSGIPVFNAEKSTVLWQGWNGMGLYSTDELRDDRSDIPMVSTPYYVQPWEEIDHLAKEAWTEVALVSGAALMNDLGICWSEKGRQVFESMTR
jgi:hypothetical protein